MDGNWADHRVFSFRDEGANLITMVITGWALQLAKSDGRLAEPERWRSDIWYRLAVERKVVARGLAENWPGHSFSKDWTHGLLSVSTQVWNLDGMI